MSSKQPKKLIAQATKLALDTATGRNALSKFVAPGLFLMDAALCALIIWKVPCELQEKKCN